MHVCAHRLMLCCGLLLCPAPDESGERAAKPIRVLFTDLGGHSTGVADRLKKLDFQVTVVPWTDFDPATVKDADVIFLPTFWAGDERFYQHFEGKAEAVRKFVERGGGLIVCQPNANQCTPTLLPYPITFRNGYDSTEPARINLAPDHFITEDLRDDEMPFPADPILKIDPRYQVLAKQKSTGFPSLAVTNYGDGRIVVQTANESYAATIPIGDEILRRMITWSAGREPARRKK